MSKPAARCAEGSKRTRAILIAFLGGKCVDCGCTDYRKLQFDHNRERVWNCRQKNRWTRVALYLREAIFVNEDGRPEASGEIELRCEECNKRKGPPIGTVAVLAGGHDDTPF